MSVDTETQRLDAEYAAIKELSDEALALCLVHTKESLNTYLHEAHSRGLFLTVSHERHDWRRTGDQEGAPFVTVFVERRTRL
jgi:hypothetical protein